MSLTPLPGFAITARKNINDMSKLNLGISLDYGHEMPPRQNFVLHVIGLIGYASNGFSLSRKILTN
jgi:hypothetical protein